MAPLEWRTRFAGVDSERVWLVTDGDTTVTLTGYSLEGEESSARKLLPGWCHDQEVTPSEAVVRVVGGAALWTEEEGCVFAQRLSVADSAPETLGAGTPYDDDDFSPRLDVRLLDDGYAISWLAGDPSSEQVPVSDDDPIALMQLDCQSVAPR